MDILPQPESSHMKVASLLLVSPLLLVLFFCLVPVKDIAKYKISNFHFSKSVSASSGVDTNVIEKKVVIPDNKIDTEKTSTLVFVGDIMLSRAIGRGMVRNNDWNYPFLKIAETLKNADLTFGNLEGPISKNGTNERIKEKPAQNKKRL